MNEFLSYIIETLLFLGLLVSTYFYLQQVLNLNELLISKMLTLCISYSVSFNLQKFIAQKIPITPNAFKYFLENDRERLLHQYQNLLPYNSSVHYHMLVPYHSNGLSKKIIDYREYFQPQNIVIKHFSSYINEKDEYENDQNQFKIIQTNGEELSTNNLHKFTLIYALTVCQPTPHLIREIEALYHEEVAFIIFYDNKSNRTQLYQLFSTVINNKKFTNVYFVDSPRFHVGWGQITQAMTQLVMAASSLKYFRNSMYLSFHSESDYPIVPNDVIVSFLKEKYPNNYMEVIPPGREGLKKMRKNDFRFYFNQNENEKIIKMIRYLFPKKIIPDAKWRSGANWFTLTMNDIDRMMKKLYQRFDLIDTLDYCLFADELIFVTLATEVDVKNINYYLRYISWHGIGKMPATFAEDRYNEIVEPRCAFWSRKYDVKVSMKVLNMIDNHIKNFPPTNFSKYCHVL